MYLSVFSRCGIFITFGFARENRKIVRIRWLSSDSLRGVAIVELKKESGVSSQESESISRGFKPATD